MRQHLVSEGALTLESFSSGGFVISSISLLIENCYIAKLSDASLVEELVVVVAVTTVVATCDDDGDMVTGTCGEKWISGLDMHLDRVRETPSL
nr:uncharacterized protein CTRU02_11259 [Colletotrichum truncatum]KAF6786001.1 hypothetical protein CTRU02_11259 [Colletotrichum truncatum]